MSTSTVFALVAGAMGALRWWQRPPEAAAVPQPERVEPKLLGPNAKLEQLRAERLQHVETYVLASRFADWMRETGADGVYLPQQIDNLLGVYCDHKNYCIPREIVFRSALALHEGRQSMHGVTRKRVWRSDPLFSGLEHLTDVQRPHLYIIHKTKPGTQVYEPILDGEGRGASSVASGSNARLGGVQTKPGRTMDGPAKRQKYKGQADPYEQAKQRRAAAC